MSIHGFLGGEEFPAEMANLITLDWSVAAYSGHTRVRDDIATYAHKAEDHAAHLNAGPTELTVWRDDPNMLSVELTTPVLPTAFGADLLDEPEPFYLDQIGALICAHLFSIDQSSSASSSSLGLIVPRLDVEDMAEQLRWVRDALPRGDIDEPILKLPSSGMRISVHGTRERGYTFAIRSSHAILDFREIVLDETS